MEPIEQVALAEQVAFRRVDVLRAQGVVLVELPCLESAHAAARVGQREEEPPHEVVVPAPVHEPGRRQLVARESLRRGRPRQRRAAGRESDPELLRDRLTEPARREVLPRERTGLGLPEVALVERRRALEQRVEPLLPLPLAIRFR